MEINNKLLAMIVMGLGIFLTLVSLKLSGVIENTDNCVKKRSLLNSNRVVLMLGLLMFSSGAAYFMCKMNCTGEIKGSASEMMYVGFNLVVGIVVLVLFSIIRNQLNDCAPSLSGLDSMLVNIGILIGVVSVLLSLVVLGKNFYANKDNLGENVRNLRGNLKESAGNLRENLKERAGNLRENLKAKLPGSSSPMRMHDVPYADPFGFDDIGSDDEL
jgi:uncharacterized protein YjbJ (UPF0337 family)